MDEKSLKTSRWQRVLIMVVAILLLSGTIFTSMFFIFANSKSGGNGDDELIKEITQRYQEKQTEINEIASKMSETYFDQIHGYQSEVKAYNAQSANSKGIDTKDLKKGNGKELKEGDNNYYAYYVGWCPDGSIFDASYNDKENPTSLKAPLDASMGFIEGWNQGVVGMKLGGIREITMSGDLAYGEQEICGSKNSPLKFIVLPIEAPEDLAKANEELNEIYVQLQTAYGSKVE